MRFEPDYKIELLGEADFPSRMAEIERHLEECAVRGTFASFDGCAIAYEYYLTQNAGMSIIISHGFTEFMQKYRELAWYLLRLGCNVFLYDLRGHGLSGRVQAEEKCVHVNRFGDYVKDLEAYLDQVARPASGGVPICLYGHSMGGAVTALYLENGGAAEKAILSSPMVCPHTGGVPRLVAKAACVLGALTHGWDRKFFTAKLFDPRPPFETSPDASRARFDANLAVRLSDECYQDCMPTNRWVCESLGVQGKILNRRALSRVKAKVKIFCGDCDRSVEIAPIKRLARRLGQGEATVFHGAKHTLYTAEDEQRKTYFMEIFAFLGLTCRA